MKTLFFYLLQVIIASGILYSYYHFALRNKRFHRYNRFYLVAATLISLIIPFLNIPVYFSKQEADSSIVVQTLTFISSPGVDQTTPAVSIGIPETATTWFTWELTLYLIYFLIAFVFFLRIIISLLKINRMIRNNPVEQLDKINFVNTSEPGTPFSFFRWLFWNRKIELNSEKGKQVFRHEMFHIEQKHSLDIMYLELLSVFCWINPFFHLAKKEVKAIHEFLADEYAITENNKWEYAELLLMQALNTPLSLVNPFFHNQIKRRIAMITSSKKPGYQYLRKLMVFPVAVIVLALFAFNYKEKNKENEDHPLSTSNDISFADTTKKRVPGKIVWIEEFIPAKKSPTAEQLKLWADPKIYGVWLDNKRVDNSLLSKYQASDFSYYIVSKLEKNATNYGKHFYQVGLLTNHYYTKVYLNPESVQKFMMLRDTTKPLFKNFSNQKTLIVIDGIVKDDLTADNIDENINVNSIESVTILKGPSAHSKYGDKGNNGVIEITTKSQGRSIAPHLNDTLPKPHTKQSVLYFQKEKVVLESATVIYKPNPGKNKLDLDKVLVIINGEKKNNTLLINKTIIAERITVYSKGDAEAVKLYGKEAENGAMIFEDATIHDIPPMEFYKDDFIKAKPSDPNNIIFDKVEIEPSFPGGVTKWKEFLNANIKSTIPVDRGAPAGTYTVIVQFIVHTDGSISDLRTLTKHGFGMEEEALRVIKSGPKWVPAMQNGIKVNAYRKQPVNFVISEEHSASEGEKIRDPLPEKSVRAYSRDFTDRSNWDRNNPEFMEWRSNAIKEVIALARKEGKAAYYYKGRTYVFARIDETKPSNVNSFYESDGVTKQFILNGRLIHSIEEINALYSRKDIRRIHLVFADKAKEKYNVKGAILEIETLSEPITNKINTVPSVQQTDQMATIPKISLAELRQTTVYKLLQLEEGTEIVSFMFTTDMDDGTIAEVYNSGNQFSEATKKMIAAEKPGRLITVDQIRTRKNGSEKKMPGKMYKVVS